MAKNYSAKEAIQIIAEGKDIALLNEVGKRFPLLSIEVAKIVATAGDPFVRFSAGLPDNLSAGKVNKYLKGDAADEAADEIAEEAAEEVVEKTAKKEVKAQHKAKNPYEGKKAPALYTEAKERGLSVKPRQKAEYYIDLLLADDAKPAEEEVEEEWEEEEPVKEKKAKATKASKAKAKAKEEEEEDEEDWDI